VSRKSLFVSAPTYTPEQRAKRDASGWTRVQAILAPIQFLAFLISFGLVVRYLLSGEGYVIANISVLIKIALLWLITITGMIWEKEVFGHWFLAPQFFWEDVGNAVAMVAHNLYFLAVWLGWSDRGVMTLMLIAYITYLFNCTQFILRGLQARQERQMRTASLVAGDRQ
jgi:3-vinyl bacteriochlorophyllide hydratase